MNVLWYRVMNLRADFLWISKSSGTRWCAFCAFIVLPMAVSAALAAVFVGREHPYATISSFVFFSTLYLFWSGLFQSCRAINGAVETGEWAYWVLGVRRSKMAYVWALICHRSAQLFVIALSFWVMVWLGMCFVWPGEWTVALVGPYCESVPSALDKAAKILLTQSNPGTQLCLTDRLTDFAQWRFLAYFGWGLACAGFSGVMLGLLFSACCRRSKDSLTFSIGFLMLVMIVSFLSFRPTGVDPKDQKESNTAWEVRFRSPTFLPIRYEYAICKQAGPSSLWTVMYHAVPDTAHNDKSGRDVFDRYRILGLLQFASHFLPQRYFFNLAHITVPRLGYLSRGVREDWESVEEDVADGRIRGNVGAYAAESPRVASRERVAESPEIKSALKRLGESLAKSQRTYPRESVLKKRWRGPGGELYYAFDVQRKPFLVFQPNGGIACYALPLAASSATDTGSEADVASVEYLASSELSRTTFAAIGEAVAIESSPDLWEENQQHESRKKGCDRAKANQFCGCVFCLGLVPTEWHFRYTEVSGDNVLRKGTMWMPRNYDSDHDAAIRQSLEWDRDVLDELWWWTGVCEFLVLLAYWVLAGLVLWWVVHFSRFNVLR